MLQRLTREAILGVLDTDAYNRENEPEKADAAELAATRQIVMRALRR